MSYENAPASRASYLDAPATEMLATQCAICARPLVDAQSAETGIGPVCRKKYLIADAVSSEARVEGNKLIHTIAKLQRGPEVLQAIARLADLGFSKVVKRIRKRIKPAPPKLGCRLSYMGDRLYLETPWSPTLQWGEWLNAMRSIGGMRYEGRGKGNSFPRNKAREVYAILCKFFSGIPGSGPKGDFIIGHTA